MTRPALCFWAPFKPDARSEMTIEAESAPETAPLRSGVALTPLDPAFAGDPQPALDALRKREPVHHDTQFERWVLSRHDDVDALLRDRSLAVDPRKANAGTFMANFAGDYSDHDPSILLLDPPEHTRLRSIVTKAFTPRAIEEMRPRIQQIIDELLDPVADRASFDLIASFAGPLATIVIAEMLGVDPDRRADFKRWSDDGVMSFDPTISPEMRQRVVDSSAELDAYFREAITERRTEPRTDLITSMIAAEDNGQHMTDDQLVTMCALLLAAGNVTTTDLIGNGVHALLSHPDQLQKLRKQPALIHNAIEEVLRYDSPVTETARIPMSDTQIDGCPMRAGESIVPLLHAANHDPAVYPDPHRFDITRADTHHHSFGGGAHFCLGAPLARVETQMAIATLVQRFPTLHLGRGPLEYRTLPGFQGFARLLVMT